MVPPASHRVSRVPWYSGCQTESPPFRLQGFHLLWLNFHSIQLKRSFVTQHVWSATPTKPKLIGLGCSRFARRYLGNRLFSLSSSGYLDVSVPQVPSTYTMCSYRSTGPLRPVGFPIRKSPDQRLLSASRGLS